MPGLSALFPLGSTGQGVDEASAGYDKKVTTPPEHYTEGTLQEDMKAAAKFISDPVLREQLKEAGGLGTPATVPSIIESLKKKEHVIVKGKKLISTELGQALHDITPDDLKDPGKTAIWEAYLKKIAGGTGSLEAFMSSQSEHIRSDIARLKAANLSVSVSDKPGSSKPTETRPCASIGCTDGGNLRLLKGKHGPFWACDKRDSGCCNKIRTQKNSEPFLYDPTDDLEAEKIDGEGGVCPTCNKGRLVARTIHKQDSKMYGKKFLACSVQSCNFRKWPEDGGSAVASGGGPARGSNSSGGGRSQQAPTSKKEIDPLVGDGDPCRSCGNGILKTNVVSNPESKAYGKRFLSCNKRCGAKSIFEDQIPSGAKSVSEPLKADHTKAWRLPGEGKPCPRCSSDLVTQRVSADHRTSANRRFLQCSNPICNHVIWEDQAMRMF